MVVETCSVKWVAEEVVICSCRQEVVETCSSMLVLEVAWASHIPCRGSWEHKQRAWLGGQPLHMSWISP